MTIADWNRRASKLVGKKIVGARYMTLAESEEMGWENQPLVLVLDDGTFLFPSSDDEGNGAGAMFSNDDDFTFPVM